MEDPFRYSDSDTVNWVQDLWEHPEKVKWYRDHILFPTTNEKHFMDDLDDNPNNIKVEIPIISMDF